MLPTNEKSSKAYLSITTEIGLHSKNWQKSWLELHSKPMTNTQIAKGHHLYIISDDKIEEGDWVIIDGKLIRQCSKTVNENGFIEVIGFNAVLESACKKIIATTDTSLTTCQCKKVGYHKLSCKQTYNLPEPSQSFIKVFIEEYNKGNIITDVMVEYEKHTSAFNHIGKTPSKQERLRGCYDNGEQIVGIWSEETLKINPKDNTITIKKVNQKGEHITAFVKAVQKEFNDMNLEYLDFAADKWIEENL